MQRKVMVLVRVASVQLLSQSAAFSSSLFIPILAKQLSAGDFEVGAIVSLNGAAGFLSQYLFGREADVRGLRFFLLGGLLLSAIAAPVQILARTPAQLAAARFLVGFAGGIYPPALLAYISETGRRMGKTVSWGSLGWGVGTLVAGALASIWQAFVASAIFFTISFAIALTLPTVPERRLIVPLFPAAVIKRNLPVYSALLIRHTGASAVWATMPIHMSLLGAMPFEIGALYALNAFTQFISMYHLDRFSSSRTFAVGLLLSSLSFFLFPLATEVRLLVAPWIIVGIAWSCLYIGGLRFVTETSAEVATSTGLVGSTISLSGILGPVLGGAVSGAAGNYTAMMFLASAMTLAAMALFVYQLARNRISRQEALAPMNS
ncbi:MAG: MFS transporter [Thermoplasmata archaeon]